MFVSYPLGVDWPEVVPRAHDAQLPPTDNDPSEVDWLAFEDESEQASRLAAKNPAASSPMKKRVQTSQGTSTAESPEGVIDLEKAKDLGNKHRRLIVDGSEEEDEEVEKASSIEVRSRRERLARRQEPTPPLQVTGPTPRPPQPQAQP
jgi:hypothetical protein